jgi:hypothetical protein
MRVIKAACVALALALASGGLAYADDDIPGADWISKEQVQQKLEAAGYTHITGIEADDGHWEGKGVKDGKIMEFHVDPHTGAITKEKIDR